MTPLKGVIIFMILGSLILLLSILVSEEWKFCVALTAGGFYGCGLISIYFLILEIKYKRKAKVNPRNRYS